MRDYTGARVRETLLLLKTGEQMNLSEKDKKELIKHIQIEGTKEMLTPMSEMEEVLFEARVRNFLINEMKEEASK